MQWPLDTWTRPINQERINTNLFTEAKNMYTFKYELETLHGISMEPEDLLVEINVNVHYLDEDLDEDSDGADIVGKMKLFYLNMDDELAITFGARYILDTNATTSELGNDIYEAESSDIKDSIVSQFKLSQNNHNLFIIDRLEILPAHRGNNLGKNLIQEAICLLSSGSELVALKAHPLQLDANRNAIEESKWLHQMNFKELEPESEVAIQSLRKFYEGLGFTGIGDDGTMLRRVIS